MKEFGPELEALKWRAKGQIRQRMKALRGAVPAAARAERSLAIVTRALALPELAGARRVALFWPMLERGEVDLRSVDQALRERGASIFYPTLRGAAGAEAAPTLALAVADLSDQGRGYLEPPPEAPVAAPGEIDVIFVPALAVAESGHRLGYGAGFYDRLLPSFRPPALAVAVAFDFQLLAELPSTEGDVPVDAIVTDARVIECG
jgi:5-formyltetrahydrofolate cyclo-ligase